MFAAANEMEPELLGSPGIRHHGAWIVDGSADPHDYILTTIEII
jgi:hypothetical protein